jgi:hypothetical protein
MIAPFALSLNWSSPSALPVVDKWGQTRETRFFSKYRESLLLQGKEIHRCSGNNQNEGSAQAIIDLAIICASLRKEAECLEKIIHMIFLYREKY